MCVCGNVLQGGCRCPHGETETKAPCECTTPATGPHIIPLIDHLRAATHRYNHVVRELARQGVAVRAFLYPEKAGAVEYHEVRPCSIQEMK